MGVTQASGWVARYRDSTDRPVVIWSDEPAVRGYVVDDAGRLTAADRFANFAGYGEDEHHRMVLPAPPGWWVVYDNGEWREPVIAWLVDPTGYAVEAVTPPDSSGIVCPDAPSKTNALEFRYDPAWVQPKPPPPKENTMNESTMIQAVEVLNALEFRIGSDAWTPLDPAAKAAWREWADAEVASMSDEAVTALAHVRLGDRADRDLAQQRLPRWPGATGEES